MKHVLAELIWEECVTLAQLYNKAPIGYIGMPQIHPQNCLFPSTITHLIHPSLDRPHLPSQTASGSNQPFCHSTLSGPTDRPTDRHTQTDRWARRHVYTISAYARYIDRERCANNKLTYLLTYLDCCCVCSGWYSTRRWYSADGRSSCPPRTTSVAHSLSTSTSALSSWSSSDSAA